MIVTAALAWWDERPADLAACIRGMANIADRVVAVDGAYRRYPGATVTSPQRQADTIRKTAAKVGLDCRIIAPDRLWAGQLEKRTFLLNEAAKGSDWIVVVDADHIIHADREGCRRELAGFGPEVEMIVAPYTTPANDSKPLALTAATNWHRNLSGRTDDHRLLFRPFPDMRVEKFHWWYSGLKNGERIWILHSDTGGLGLPGTRFESEYWVEHRCLYRDERRVRAGRAFCSDRVMVVELTGQEDDVPGLPAPVFDFETVPL